MQKKKIIELKKIYETINEDKEKLKMGLQTVFTKIRNFVNNAEDKLFLELEQKFDDTFFKDELIKKSEKIPIEIKEQLERGKIIKNEWENNKLNSLINDCINIDNSIQEIQIMSKNIEKYKSTQIEIQYFLDDDEITKMLNDIKLMQIIVKKKTIFFNLKIFLKIYFQNIKIKTQK